MIYSLIQYISDASKQSPLLSVGCIELCGSSRPSIDVWPGHRTIYKKLPVLWSQKGGWGRKLGRAHIHILSTPTKYHFWG